MFLFNCQLLKEHSSAVSQAIESLEDEFDVDFLFVVNDPRKLGPAYAYSRNDQKLDEPLIRSSTIALLFPYFRIEEPCDHTNNK